MTPYWLGLVVRIVVGSIAVILALGLLLILADS